MTDTLLTAQGKSVLRIERSFAHRVETVWGALVNPRRFSSWYPATVQMEPQLGGTINLDYGNHINTTGVITALDGPQLFAFTEQGGSPQHARQGQVRFELHPEVDGTLLVFRQTFGDRSAAANYAAGWQTCFDALDLVLDGLPTRTEPVSPATIASYTALFGLDG